MTDFDKTSIYGDSGTTAAPGEGTIVTPDGTVTTGSQTVTGGTVSVSPDGTATADSSDPAEGVQAPADLVTGGKIQIGDSEYVVEKRVGSGSEAEVYVLKKGGKRYALKLYRTGRKFRREILGRLEKIKDRAATTHIFDQGTLSLSGSQRAYVLMNWCPGGSAASHDFRNNAEAILKVVTMTARNLHELHKAGILHKDTKPENILFTDNSLELSVLSDFGISDILSDDGSVNSLQSRTVIYAAPEIYTKASIIEGRTYAIMTPAYDYYALGMTALAMWMGTGEFRKQEPELVKLKMQGKVPVPDSMPEPLNSIVRGLLVNKVESRWGFDEIQRKLSGEDVPVSEEIETLHIIFDSAKGKIAHNPAELARFMMEDQQLGISYLYKGRICDWLRRPMPELEIRLNDIVETIHPRNQLAGLYEAALTLDPELPYYDCGGKTYKYLFKLCQSEQRFNGSNLSDKDNPVYIYCRHRFGKELADKTWARVSKSLSDPIDKCPVEALAWCTYETKVLIHRFHGKKSHDDSDYTRVDCHNPAEVLKFCSEYRIISTSSKKFLSSLAFVEMVRAFSEDDARALERLHSEKISDSQVMYRLVIQTLNPSADINLCSDPGDPWYAMTGAGLGKMIDMAFNAYYGLFHGDRDAMYDKWAEPSNPWRDLCQASLADLIVMSFGRGTYGSSYLQRSIATKGSRFADQDRWLRYCCDYNSTDNSNKYGPYDTAIAMMKAVSGLGYRASYRFSDGTTVHSLAELDTFRRTSKGSNMVKDAMRKGSLHAWLAVQYQENPEANLKPKYSYEKLAADYVAKLGQCDPDNNAYRRYSDARATVNRLRRGQPILILGLLQYIFISAALLFFAASLIALVAGIIEQPWLDAGLRKSIYVILGPVVFSLLLNLYFSDDPLYGFFDSIIAFFIFMGILYLASRWFIWRLVPYITLVSTALFTFHFCRKLLRKNEGAAELRSIRKPDFEQLVLEPLHHAFKSSKATFSSSFGANTSYYKDEYKDSLRSKIGPSILAIITGFLLMVNSTVGYGMLGGQSNETIRMVEDFVDRKADSKTGEDGEMTEEKAAEKTAPQDDARQQNNPGTARLTPDNGKEAANASRQTAAKAEEPKTGRQSQEIQPKSQAVQEPQFSVRISAADGISVNCGDSPALDGSNEFHFTMTNNSGADLRPFIVIEEPSAEIVARAEAIDDTGKAYSAVRGQMSVTINGAVMDASHRDPVFNFSDGQRVQAKVSIKNLDTKAERLEIRIPFREIDPDAYPYRRGYIIFKNIPIQR